MKIFKTFRADAVRAVLEPVCLCAIGFEFLAMFALPIAYLAFKPMGFRALACCECGLMVGVVITYGGFLTALYGFELWRRR